MLLKKGQKVLTYDGKISTFDKYLNKSHYQAWCLLEGENAIYLASLLIPLITLTDLINEV